MQPFPSPLSPTVRCSSDSPPSIVTMSRGIDSQLDAIFQQKRISQIQNTPRADEHGPHTEIQRRFSLLKLNWVVYFSVFVLLKTQIDWRNLLVAVSSVNNHRKCIYMSVCLTKPWLCFLFLIIECVFIAVNSWNGWSDYVVRVLKSLKW